MAILLLFAIYNYLIYGYVIASFKTLNWSLYYTHMFLFDIQDKKGNDMFERMYEIDDSNLTKILFFCFKVKLNDF